DKMHPDVGDHIVAVGIEFFGAVEAFWGLVRPLQPIEAPALAKISVRVPGIEFGSAVEPFHSFLAEVTPIAAFLAIVKLSAFLALPSQTLPDVIGGIGISRLDRKGIFERADLLGREGCGHGGTPEPFDLGRMSTGLPYEISRRR